MQVNCADLGPLACLSLVRGPGTGGKGWYLKEVHVRPHGAADWAVFPGNFWLAADPAGGCRLPSCSVLLDRLIMRQLCQGSLLSAHITGGLSSMLCDAVWKYCNRPRNMQNKCG